MLLSSLSTLAWYWWPPLLGAVALLLVHLPRFLANNFADGLTKGHRLAPPQDMEGRRAWWFPFIGHFIFAFRNRKLETMDMRLAHANAAPVPYLPEGFRLEIGGNTMISVHEPNDVRHMINNPQIYQIGDLRRAITFDFLGKGIFTTDGDFWKDQRELAKPSFHHVQLETMLPMFVKHSMEILDRIERTSVTPKAYIDVQPLFLCYTLDCAGEIFFDHPLGSIKSVMPFQQAFDYVQFRVDERVSNPFWKWIPDRKLEKSLKICNDLIYEMIQKARADPDLRKRNDLLARFMLDTKNGQQHVYDDVYIRDMLMNFMIAARDTTGVTLMWMFYELASHPEIQKKLTEEVDEALGGEPPQQVEDIGTKKMHYLHTVVNETLRLHPPVPRVLRCCEQDDVLPSGIRVEKGCNATYSPYLLHRSAVFWGKDVLTFDPTRWDDHRTEELRAMAFLPFHGGPRRCLGFEVAYNEAKTLACLILQRYTVTLDPHHEVKQFSSITLAAQYGVKLLFEPRRRTATSESS